MGRDHSETCDECGMQRGGFDDLPCACTVDISESLVFAMLNEDFLDAMRTLAENLRWAGALCQSYRLGLLRPSVTFKRIELSEGGAVEWMEREETWSPGCGKQAPP